MVQSINERLVEIRQIRPFSFQKVLFFFVSVVFYSFMFEPGLSWASSEQLPADSCALESIRYVQRLYKRQVHAEDFNPVGNSEGQSRSTELSDREIEEIGYTVIATTPHDMSAYTQGLVYFQNHLYESTGGLGSSEIRKVDLKTGQVVKVKQLPDIFFAEGLTLANNRLIQITLKKNQAFVYDVKNFKLIDQFIYSGDGWGIVTLDNNLLVSDGSSMLRQINIDGQPSLVVNKVTVNGVGLEGINEMANVNGMIYANVWPTDCIAIIDPAKYQVVAWINLAGLYPENKRLSQSSVLNGIAYDSSQKKLLVTGKYWPLVYHLELSKYPVGLLSDQSHK